MTLEEYIGLHVVALTKTLKAMKIKGKEYERFFDLLTMYEKEGFKQYVLLRTRLD